MKISFSPLLLLSMILLAAFCFLAASIKTDFVQTFDTQIIQAVQTIKNPFLNETMKLSSYIGDTFRVIIISLIILIVLYQLFHKRQELVLFLIVLIGTGVFNALLKLFFQRERPSLYTMISADGYSFPSGHSMAALSLYGIITFLLWRHIPRPSGRICLLIASTAFILTIGFSRIYLGVHYPSDVIGAYLFSGSWLLFSIWGFNTFRNKK